METLTTTCSNEIAASLGRCRQRTYPVIADRGDVATVALVDSALRPRVGDRFRHLGLLWEITGERSHGRTWVAEPVLAGVPGPATSA